MKKKIRLKSSDIKRIIRRAGITNKQFEFIFKNKVKGISSLTIQKKITKCLSILGYRQVIELLAQHIRSTLSTAKDPENLLDCIYELTDPLPRHNIVRKREFSEAYFNGVALKGCPCDIKGVKSEKRFQRHVVKLLEKKRNKVVIEDTIKGNRFDIHVLKPNEFFIELKFYYYLGRAVGQILWYKRVVNASVFLGIPCFSYPHDDKFTKTFLKDYDIPVFLVRQNDYHFLYNHDEDTMKRCDKCPDRTDDWVAYWNWINLNLKKHYERKRKKIEKIG